MKKIGSILLLIFTTFSGFGQKSMNDSEKELFELCSTFLSEQNDETKKKNNVLFIENLSELLKTTDSKDYKFDKLNSVSKIYAPDNSFRVFTWAIKFNDGSYQNNGIVQVFQKNDKILVHPLISKSREIKNPETKILSSKSWIGAVYYAVIPQHIGKKRRFAFLGLDANNPLSKIKIIEIIEIDGAGQVRFGAPVFQTEKRPFNRILMEYNAKASVSLHWDDKRKMLLFDHLSPSTPSVQGQYQFYGPDFSVDAFQLKKGKFIYLKDIDARNATENKGKGKLPESGLQPK